MTSKFTSVVSDGARTPVSVVLTDAEDKLCRSAMRFVSTKAVTGRNSYATSAALHESSHVVVALSFGLKFNHVLLVPTVQEEGAAAASVQGFNFSLNDPNQSHVHVLLAPIAASDMVPFSSTGCWGDVQNVIDIGHCAYMLPTVGSELSPEVQAWIAEMGEQTQELIKPLLKDIVRVAEVLDVRKIMSYDEVREVLGFTVRTN